MGFRADAYWHVGGFRALATGEDVELVERFEAAGLRIHRDASLSVATSDRRDGRAPGGFAASSAGAVGVGAAPQGRGAGMTAGLVGHWLSTGALKLPLPGVG